MRKYTWVLILGCLAAPLACAQQHDTASTPVSHSAAQPVSRNPIGQALTDLLRQARPAPQSAPADRATAAARPASIELAPAQNRASPQAHADATTTSLPPAADAVVIP